MGEFMNITKVLAFGLLAGSIVTVSACGGTDAPFVVQPKLPVSAEAEEVPSPENMEVAQPSAEPSLMLKDIEGAWRAQSWVVLQSDGSFRDAMQGTSKLILTVKTEGFSGLDVVYADGTPNYSDINLTYREDSGFITDERPSTVRLSNGVLIWEFTDENEEHHFTTWSREQ
jgi:hypothetical protein